jgi:hypothetical protein
LRSQANYQQREIDHQRAEIRQLQGESETE